MFSVVNKHRKVSSAVRHEPVRTQAQLLCNRQDLLSASEGLKPWTNRWVCQALTCPKAPPGEEGPHYYPTVWVSSGLHVPAGCMLHNHYQTRKYTEGTNRHCRYIGCFFLFHRTIYYSSHRTKCTICYNF